MKIKLLRLSLFLLFAASTFANNDHAADYKLGKFESRAVVDDGTLTNTVHGDGTTIAGSVRSNYVVVYKIAVADGTWSLVTMTEAGDAMIRRLGMTPQHFKSEKANPLDALKSGDKVLFRVEQHRKLNGVDTDVYIPFADNPKREFAFVGTFEPSHPATTPEKPSDNVKAMCDAHKLSPELEKQYCSPEPPAVSPTPTPETQPEQPVPPAPTVPITPADLTDPRVQQFKRMCDSGMFKQPPYTTMPGGNFAQKQCDLAFPPKPTEPKQ